MNNLLNKKTLTPNTKDELIQIIQKELELHGNECNLNHIDTSLITDMSYLFSKKYKLNEFNGDISKWDTSNVKNMEAMFSESLFNGNISKWNTENVTEISNMFYSSIFNQDISQWNTSKVTNMSFMFDSSTFNQDISQWNTENVIDMSYMFWNSRFNQDISRWDTSNVKDFEFMFYSSQFNQDISQWNTSNGLLINNMFENSKITKIPQWDYFKIDNIQYCFDNCSHLTESLPDWYQFNHITNAFDRQTSYNNYLKSKNLNHSISNNLKNNKKYINKI